VIFEHLEEKEAAKKAALIEVNGYRFYTMLAERTASAEAKKVFKRLAKDEREHRDLIEKRFFPEAGFGDLITGEEIEIESYIEKTGTADIFTRRLDVERLVSLVDTTRKALTLALDTERHSVALFEALSAKAHSEEAARIYADLVEQEKTHVALIEGLLAAEDAG